MVAAGNNKPENTIMIDNSKKKEIATTIGTKAVAWLTSKGWGATLAKVTVGAVLGAAIGIAAALGMTGCTASYSQTASGDIQYSGSIVLPVEPCKK